MKKIKALKPIPLYDKVLVQRAEPEEITEGGILIPETTKEKDKPQHGLVIAIGRGRINETGQLIPPDVKAGDRILFGHYAGQEVKLSGKDYLIMTEPEILCKLVEA